MTGGIMQRRDFIALLGAAAAAFPIAARAQQPALPVVGFLHSGSPDLAADRVVAFRKGLGENGFVEGRNVAIEFRWAEGQNDRLPALAADLVRRRVSVIATSGLPPVLAAREATTTIPIVFMLGIDPVEAGFVASLSRPGGNLTGASNLAVEVGPKRLELLHELVPMANIVALLVNPTNPTLAQTLSSDLQTASRTLGLQLHVLNAGADRDFEAVFATLAQLRVGALVIANDPFLISRGEQLGALTLRHRVPAIFLYREFAASGGLMSYGTSTKDVYGIVGAYTGRILNGEKPANLPIQRSTKVELIINMKTAKALGLTVPLSLLGSADEVIE